VTAQVGIIGVGLIGASAGMRARAAGFQVVGFDVSAQHVHDALSCGAIDEALGDERAVADGCETLVIATPVEETMRLLRAFALAPPRALLVLDVASVKACVVQAAQGLAGFVATHPIAGSERGGPQAARADLFMKRTWAYVPSSSSAANARVCAFIEMTGARAVAFDAVEHDRIVAATSHLPQLLSVALAAHLRDALEEPATRALSGSGLRSMTRLGASSWSMWRGILANNGANAAREARALAAILSSIAEEAERGDAACLAARFAAAADAVRRLDATDPSSACVL
jgi:prephenate dehydrogenase